MSCLRGRWGGRQQARGRRRYLYYFGNKLMCASWEQERSRWPGRLRPRVPAMTGRFVLGAGFPSHPCCWYNCALPLGLMLSAKRDQEREIDEEWLWSCRKDSDSIRESVLSARVALTVKSQESWVEAVTVAGFFKRDLEGPTGNSTIANYSVFEGDESLLSNVFHPCF